MYPHVFPLHWLKGTCRIFNTLHYFVALMKNGHKKINQYLTDINQWLTNISQFGSIVTDFNQSKQISCFQYW